jgi:flagellar biosynthetic protein FliQ
MTPEFVLTLGQKMLEVVAMLTAPMLIPALLVGLVIGMFQAATQINEMTLSFVPKVAMVAVVLVFAGHWMLSVLVSFTRELFENIPALIG